MDYAIAHLNEDHFLDDNQLNRVVDDLFTYERNQVTQQEHIKISLSSAVEERAFQNDTEANVTRRGLDSDYNTREYRQGPQDSFNHNMSLNNHEKNTRVLNLQSSRFPSILEAHHPQAQALDTNVGPIHTKAALYDVGNHDVVNRRNLRQCINFSGDNGRVDSRYECIPKLMNCGSVRSMFERDNSAAAMSARIARARRVSTMRGRRLNRISTLPTIVKTESTIECESQSSLSLTSKCTHSTASTATRCGTEESPVTSHATNDRVGRCRRGRMSHAEQRVKNRASVQQCRRRKRERRHALERERALYRREHELIQSRILAHIDQVEAEIHNVLAHNHLDEKLQEVRRLARFSVRDESSKES